MHYPGCWIAFRNTFARKEKEDFEPINLMARDTCRHIKTRDHVVRSSEQRMYWQGLDRSSPTG